MTMSGREKAIAAITIMVLLYGVLGIMAKGRLAAWQVKRENYRQVCLQLDQQRKLIAQRSLWQKNYAGIKDLMPVFPADKPVDTYWGNVLDNAATRNQLIIRNRQPPKEALVGDVYEMMIDCKDWEGSLDALVRFLYDLESAGVMLDMREMFVRPLPADHSRLKGSFKLFCAYMRERPVEVSGAPEVASKKVDDAPKKLSAVPAAPATNNKVPAKK